MEGSWPPPPVPIPEEKPKALADQKAGEVKELPDATAEKQIAETPKKAPEAK